MLERAHRAGLCHDQHRYGLPSRTPDCSSVPVYTPERNDLAASLQLYQGISTAPLSKCVGELLDEVAGHPIALHGPSCPHVPLPPAPVRHARPPRPDHGWICSPESIALAIEAALLIVIGRLSRTRWPSTQASPGSVCTPHLCSRQSSASGQVRALQHRPVPTAAAQMNDSHMYSSNDAEASKSPHHTSGSACGCERSSIAHGRQASHRCKCGWRAGLPRARCHPRCSPHSYSLAATAMSPSLKAVHRCCGTHRHLCILSASHIVASQVHVYTLCDYQCLAVGNSCESWAWLCPSQARCQPPALSVSPAGVQCGGG